MNCDVFLAVEFGCARRQRHERDDAWNDQGFGAMPAQPDQEDNDVRPEGDFGCDLVGMELHGFAVAGRQPRGDGADLANFYGPLAEGKNTTRLPLSNIGPRIGTLEAKN
jgi:hypothetical protein